jgi:14-3-3 protein epsilon
MESLNINDVAGTGHINADQTTLTPEELLECCLIGKLMVNKPARFGALQDRLALLWQPGQGVEVRAMEENKFMFQFFHPWDMERIYQGSPWLFENHMLILRKVQFGEDPIAIPMDTTEIWVQVHHLPFGFMGNHIGWLIGNHIGKYVKYDDLNNCGSWRKYMRIRVAIRINEPLKKNWVFERDGGEPVEVHFKYEKLGNFCFSCGIIGHTDNYCSKRLEAGFIDGEKGWGSYLRAENSNTSGGITANKWLRGGRSSGSGGRGGAINAGINAGTNHAVINANVRLHTLHGRIKIGRDSSTRRLIFFKLMEEKQEGINTGNHCWVRFDVFSGKLLNANEEGNSNRMRSLNDQRLIVHVGPQSTNDNYSLQNMGIEDITKDTGAAAIGPLGPNKLPPQLLLEGTSSNPSKELVPKKRPRQDKDILNQEEIIKSKAPNMDEMQVEPTHAATGVAENDIIMQQNPLFDVNIVMAGPGHQACQKK